MFGLVSAPLVRNKCLILCLINSAYNNLSEHMQRSPSPRRRSSLSSTKSFHSIDEFKYSSPFEQYVRTQKFPFRPAINILLIILTTVQVFVLVNSRIYLRGELVRSFLSIYVDKEQYPDLFEGKQFYLDIINIQEMQQHLEYMFKRINIIQTDSFVDFFYNDAKFLLHTEYKEFAGSQHRQNVHPIDPKIGIVEPFDMRNITDLQLYLLQVSQFQIQIQNLTMTENWEGFSERYEHDITYTFVDNIKVQINFEFRISNAMLKPDDNDHDGVFLPSNLVDCLDGTCYHRDVFGQKSFRTLYIVRIRIFYGLVLLLSLISLYLNYVSIKRTYKILYEQLANLQQEHENMKEPRHSHGDDEVRSPHPLLSRQEENQIRHDVHKWVQSNKMTFSEIKLEHYFHILEFDIIFSTLSNIFETITAFYLVSGIEKERMAGITCLFSWMTIFKLVRNYKKLVLMYELIKLSIAKVTSFFVEFLPVFIAYALLGVCLFPKVSFFSSLANSVTTLVCLMMGDSIQMITDSILQKNSILLAMTYIFSFVLLFMHAIHNTLTSLIKQFFIIKKIELVKYQKERLNESNYIYVEQLKMSSEVQKQKLPLKLTNQLARGLLRIKALNKTKRFQEACVLLFHEIDNIRITEKWMISEYEMEKMPEIKQELVRRSMLVSKYIEQFDRSYSSPEAKEGKGRSEEAIKKESLLSEVESN